MGITPLGLLGFHGSGYAAVDEVQIIIPEDRIRTHNQTEHIYDIYYNLDKFKFPIRKSAILGKLKEIQGLRGDVHIVCRTRNSAD